MSDPRKHLTQHNYSGIADLYTIDFGSDREHFADFLVPLIDQIKKKGLAGPIIDLGSGPGNVIDYVLEFPLKNPLVAVDFTPEFCEKLRSKYHGNDRVLLVYGDFVEYVATQPHNSVAAYLANYSIIHVPDEEVDGFFTSLYESLAPGGMFVCSVWEGEKKGMEHEPYQVQHDPRLQVRENLESYLNSFTENELRSRLEEAGFSIVKSEVFLPTASLVSATAPEPGEFLQRKLWVVGEKGR
jgi:SAM-dependent methyltransferase